MTRLSQDDHECLVWFFLVGLSQTSVFLKLDVLGGGCGCPQPRLARWILELLILDPFSDRRVIVCTMRNFFQGLSFNACPGNLIEPLALLLSSSSRVAVYDHCTQWYIILGDRNFFVRYALTSFTDRKAGLFLGYSGSGRLWAGCSGLLHTLGGGDGQTMPATGQGDVFLSAASDSSFHL